MLVTIILSLCGTIWAIKTNDYKTIKTTLLTKADRLSLDKKATKESLLTLKEVHIADIARIEKALSSFQLEMRTVQQENNEIYRSIERVLGELNGRIDP